MTFRVYLKSNKRSLLDAILNILGIVSISDLDDYTSIADLIMNVCPKFNLFIYLKLRIPSYYRKWKI